MSVQLKNYSYDDHSSVPFKIIRLKPSPDFDKGVQPHRHNYYELFVFKSGTGIHYIDFDRFDVDTNTAHIVPPGNVHLLQRGTMLEGFVLLFSREFSKMHHIGSLMVNEPLNVYIKKLSPSIQLEEAEFTQLFNTLESIQKEYESDNNFKYEIIKSYLNIALTLLFRGAESSELKHLKNNAANSFEQLVEQNFNQGLNVSDYAEKLSLSTASLNQISKTAFGVNASVFIQNRILLEVKRLLLHSEATVKEIGYFLQFNDMSYFARFIKKHTALTPQELRSKLRETYYQ